MNKINSRRLLTASSLAALLALGACGERIADNNTVQPANTVATTPAVTEARPGAADSNTAVMGAPSTGAAATSTGPTVGERIDDGQITARVNAGLAADSNLSAIRIDVDTREGVVTLTGPVPDAAAKERAEEIAKGVSEVKSVNNQLTVSAS